MAFLAVSLRACAVFSIKSAAETRWTEGLRCPDLHHSGEFP
jgi:hypothetical protein